MYNISGDSMKLKNTIKSMALSSLLSALITTFILIGSLFDIFDLICASVCSIIIHIINEKIRTRTAFMIYSVSSVISFILMPLRSCSLYFIAFFGYYPIIRQLIFKKIKNRLVSYTILMLIYNLTTISLYVIFANLFGLNNEPVYMYIALIVTSNIFYFAFDLLISRIMIIYNYKLHKMFGGRRSNK